MRLWDSSAFLSLLLEQSGTARLKAILAADQEMALWWGTKVEAVSAVCRMWRAHAFDESLALELLCAIDQFVTDAHEIVPSQEVRETACRLLRLHALRAADALQLGAALVWAGAHPFSVPFVCLDQRLRQAAEREGFDVLPK